MKERVWQKYLKKDNLKSTEPLNRVDFSGVTLEMLVL